ncbi:AraC family transcriptional regulator [Peribacillus deserti]|uniref:AraC family transcriptional regulator n=1 Tax=Peribacillus deserti TaxID=673318 RepID=A0A2N5M8B3_9BACI|nr:helix-turn-helix domain-containing protein [Peribacillus deserti]PLT30621.1 AraC family transcriptional regulator [Peribacillus deserti]
MEYFKVIQKVVDYIDEHIQTEITVSDLAKFMGYSPFHFLRIFKEAVGVPPMEYVTRRKMQFALRDMGKQTSMNDVAFNYGYDSYAGFAKAFKKVFGMSPSKYRIHCPNAEPPVINLEELKSYKTGGLISQPKIIKLDSFSMVGRTYEVPISNVRTTRDAPAYWHLNGLTDGEIERTLYQTFAPKKHGEFCLNMAHEQDWSSFTYFFGILDEKPDQPLSPAFQRITAPASSYAVFSTPAVQPDEFVDSVKGTWRYILHYWFPQSDYVIDEAGYDFEFYDERCHPWEHDLVMMEIYIPIELRNERQPG